MDLPLVNGSTVLDAALAFADAGVPVAPFDPNEGNRKNCGNILGNSRYRADLGLPDGGRWYEYATTHKPTLERWHQTRPFEAIATSPGRFGTLVLDIDKPELFPVEQRNACRTTAHVITRKRRRGHYFFALPPTATAIGNPAFEWGEVRCIGGGLVLPPYPHDNRRVARSGRLSIIGADLLSLIAGSGVVEPDLDLDVFCAKYRGNKYPHKLKGLMGLLHE